MRRSGSNLKAGMRSAISSLMAIVMGLLVGYVILIVSNASQANAGMLMIIKGGFSGGMKGLGQVLYFATPIILTGLSVGFAFKTGLFNIGAPGQFIVGAFAAVYVGVNWTFLPGHLHWIVAIICAMIAGFAWGLVPGLFKALFNVNEVISSIMMNYIGMYGVNYLVKTTIYDSMKAQSKNVAANAVIPKWGLDSIFNNPVMRNVTGTQLVDGVETQITTQVATGKLDISSVNGGIIIAILAVIIVYIILSKTTFGYELKACGFSRDASRYAGINEKRSIILSMAIAGLLAGLGGALLYLAPSSGKHIKVLDELAAEGFNGIPVALLGMSNPIGILIAGLFISHIEQGGFYLQGLQYMPEVIDIIIGVIIYFSAASLLVQKLLDKLRRHSPGDKAVPDKRQSGKGGGD